VNSATSALHIANLAAGVGPGENGITSPITFVASANGLAYCGAAPRFADVDPETYNLDPQQVAGQIDEKTRVIVPVHFAGQSCDMKAFAELASGAEKKFGKKVYIVEDASHALGSKYQGAPVGDCRFSDMAVFSFHPVKHITSGEGGAVTTNCEQLYHRMRMFRTHGIAQDSRFWEGVSPGRWYYEQQELGYNYRLTDLQSALAINQLAKLPNFLKRRREIVKRYKEAFAGKKNMILPLEREEGSSNFHLYVLQFDFERMGLNRDSFMERLRAQNVGVQVHYIPVHTQPYYRKNFGTRWGMFPRAEKYYQHCLSIPLFPAMLDTEVDRVIDAILESTGNK
jgi:dTDP-4-amino-4,6-dideoxygalactose transaminase